MQYASTIARLSIRWFLHQKIIHKTVPWKFKSQLSQLWQLWQLSQLSNTILLLLLFTALDRSLLLFSTQQTGMPDIIVWCSRGYSSGVPRTNADGSILRADNLISRCIFGQTNNRVLTLVWLCVSGKDRGQSKTEQAQEEEAAQVLCHRMDSETEFQIRSFLHESWHISPQTRAKAEMVDILAKAAVSTLDPVAKTDPGVKTRRLQISHWHLCFEATLAGCLRRCPPEKRPPVKW